MNLLNLDFKVEFLAVFALLCGIISLGLSSHNYDLKYRLNSKDINKTKELDTYSLFFKAVDIILVLIVLIINTEIIENLIPNKI